MIRRHFSRALGTWRNSDVVGVLLRGSAASFLINVCGYALSFALQVLIARLLGAAEYGVFSYAMAWMSIGLIVGKAGFDLAIVRFLPGYSAAGQWGHFQGLSRFGRWFPAGWAAVVAAIGTAGLELSGDSPHRATFLVALWLLPVAVFSELTSMVLRALRHVVASLAGDSLLRPLITAAVLLLYTRAAGWEASSFAAMASYATATALACGFAVLWLRRCRPAYVQAVRSTYMLREWFLASLPLMFAAGFQIVLYSMDTLMLGSMLDTTTAGFYSAASKVALLTLFAMNAAQVIAGPLIAESWSRKRHAELQRIVRMTIQVSMLVALPAALTLIMGGRLILGAFGERFTAAQGALGILALVQLFNVATGPVGLLLGMSGHQNRLVAYLGIGLAVNFLLNLWWIPLYGLNGAACSTAIAHVIWNSLGILFIWKKLRINCTPLPLRSVGSVT